MALFSFLLCFLRRPPLSWPIPTQSSGLISIWTNRVSLWRKYWLNCIRMEESWGFSKVQEGRFRNESEIDTDDAELSTYAGPLRKNDQVFFKNHNLADQTHREAHKQAMMLIIIKIWLKLTNAKPIFSMHSTCSNVTLRSLLTSWLRGTSGLRTARRN